MRRRIVWAAIAAGLVAGCATIVPPAPPRLDAPSVAARFAARLAERRERGAVAEGDYSAWAHREGAKNPPGVTVHVRLGAPDAFRLRVDGLIGTAVDAAAHRDTLVIDAPAIDLSAVTDAGGDRSSRQDLGGWVWRALAAGWSPPAEAWTAGAAVDSLWRVAWVEAGDSLSLDVAASGLPLAARVGVPGSTPIEVRYERWAPWNGVMWPARVVVRAEEGRLQLTLQPQSLALRPRARAAAPLSVPAGARRLSRARLLAMVKRLALAAGVESGAMDSTTADSSKAGGR